MSVEMKPEKPKMRRGLRIILIASLTVNLVFAGLAVGAVVGHARDGDDHMPSARGLPPHVRAFERDHRRAIAKEIRQAYRAENLGPRAERRQWEEVAAMVAAEPFDAKALAAFQDGITAKLERRIEIANAVWIEHLAGMDAVEREGYADSLRRVLEHRKAPPRPDRAPDPAPDRAPGQAGN